MRRSRLALSLDWLAIVLLLATLAIYLGGGFAVRTGGVRLSARSPERPLVAALLVIGVRVLLDRRTRPLGRAPSVLGRAAARAVNRAADPGPPPESSRWRDTTAAALGLCAFGAVMLYPQLQRMDSVPDLGDPLFSMWRIGWVSRYLLGDPRPLFDANIFHPEPLTLTYSDSMLLPAVTTAPLLWVGLHPVLAYNVAFVASFLFSGIAAYLLVSRVTGSSPAGFVAALIFGFYPYRFEHYSHFELQMTYWMPLALLALHRFIVSLRMRDAALAALCVGAQLYCSMYYGVFLPLYAAVVFLLLCLPWRVDLRRVAAPVAVAGALVVALAVPLARPYLAAQQIKGVRDIPGVTVYSATPADYLRPQPRSAAWGERTLLPGRQPERALFPGIMAPGLAALALVPPIGVTRIAYLGGLVFAFDGSLGFNGLLYPTLYEWLLPIRGLRVPARFSVLVGLSLAVLAGFGVRRLLAGASTSRTIATLAVVIGAVALDLRPVLPLVKVWFEPPPIYRSLRDAPDVVLAEFPMGGDPRGYTENVPFMYFSLWHGAQLINGYSGFYPPSYFEITKAIEGFPEDQAVDALKARGATHVTVNCALYEDANTCPALLDALAASRRVIPVSSGHWEGSPVVLYRLLP